MQDTASIAAHSLIYTPACIIALLQNNASLKLNPPQRAWPSSTGETYTGSVGVVFLVVPDEGRVLVATGHQLLQELRR